MKRITQFDGLYGAIDRPSQRTNGEYLFSELLETRSYMFDWVIQPHTHARLFQVFFMETGGVEFSDATQKRQLTAPVVLLIPPAALHGFVYTPDAKGRILTLSDSLFSTLFPTSSPVVSMLGAVQCIQAFDELYTVGPRPVGPRSASLSNSLSRLTKNYSTTSPKNAPCCI